MSSTSTTIQQSRRSEKMKMQVEEEDKLELCESRRGVRIAAGASYTLKRINLETSGALLAGCLFTLLLIVLLLLITLVPATRAFDLCRCSDNDCHSSNVYFIKHEKRRWTMHELCCIEIAARRYPSKFLITMINLRNDDSFDDTSNEVEPRLRLLQIPNIRNVDVEIEQFFQGSILSKAIINSTTEQIELAAKFQVIWDSSGISLEPRNIAQLESVLYFFDDQVDTTATIQIEADLQAASVPCQSFIGFIIKHMAEALTDRRTIVNRTLSNFCPRLSECAGVRIIKTKSRKINTNSTTQWLQCPIVNSHSMKANR